MAKCTRAEINRRVREVRRALLKGHTRAWILDFCLIRFKVEDRMADKYMELARKELDEINQGTAEADMALIASNFWNLFRNTQEDSPGTARLVLKDIVKLKGLDKLEFAHHVDRPHQSATDDDLAAAIGGK